MPDCAPVSSARPWGPLRRLFAAFSSRVRAKRGALMLARLPVDETTRILDLGGGNGSYLGRLLGPGYDVTVADVVPEDLAAAERAFGYKTHLLDGSDTLPWEAGAFDLVFCNSVIEHVAGGAGDCWQVVDSAAFERRGSERQKRFAAEIARVGRGYWVQSPWKHFPVESHTWLPALLVVYLPRRQQVGLIRAANGYWVKRTTPDWRLLTKRDMEAMFPDAEIVVERWLGLPKSIIALRGR